MGEVKAIRAPRLPGRTKYARLTSEERRAGLIEAARACISRGGIQDFTVDKICVEAGISRGLIAHHFGSINGLLAAVYAVVYLETTPDPASFANAEARIVGLIDSYVDPRVFNRPSLNVWIALWGQISVNAELGAEHRRLYAAYLDVVSNAITELAAERSRQVKADDVAKALICLVDGLGLQHCLDPVVMPPLAARALCLGFLEQHLGPIG